MKSRKSEQEKTSVSVSSFVEAGAASLMMELVAGEQGLNRAISEAAINRPGLALTGFFKHFAHRRIQVLGLAEQAYLDSLAAEESKSSLHAFFDHKIPCVVITRNRKPPDELLEMAEVHGVPVLRTQMITKHFVNAATIIMENLKAPRMTVQGTMIEIMGIGVLLTGKAGIGKSETAMVLIRRGGALVSDDITALRLDSSGSIIASPVNVTRYHMEIRGLGIVHVPSLFGVASVREEKKLDLVVRFCRESEMESEMAAASVTREILSVQSPHIVLPVAPGRDLGNVVESAALDQKLRRLGHDAAKELDENLMSLISGGRNGIE